jgi:hypothetical protein
MTTPQVPAWCEDPGSLDDAHLGLLLESIISVLRDGAASPDEAEELLALPSGPRAAELNAVLRDAGVLTDVNAGSSPDADRDRTLGLALVRSICVEPGLRNEVDEAYRARQGLMVLDPVTLLAAAGLLLVMKLRHVEVGKGRVVIKLDPVRNVMVGLLKQVTGS